MVPTGSWHTFSQPLGLDAARGAGVAISTEGYSWIEITNSDFVAQVRGKGRRGDVEYGERPVGKLFWVAPEFYMVADF